jgi:hypothetical protein
MFCGRGAAQARPITLDKRISESIVEVLLILREKVQGNQCLLIVNLKMIVEHILALMKGQMMRNNTARLRSGLRRVDAEPELSCTVTQSSQIEISSKGLAA